MIPTTKERTLFLSTDRSLGLLLVNPPEAMVASYEAGRKARKNFAVRQLDGLACGFRRHENQAKGTRCLVADFAGRGHIARVFALGLDTGPEAARYFRRDGDMQEQVAGRRWLAAVTNGQAHRIGVVFLTPAEDQVLIEERKIKAERAEAMRLRDAAVLTRRKAEAEAAELAKLAAELVAIEVAERAAKRDENTARALGVSLDQLTAMTPKQRRAAEHNARLAGKLKD